MYMRVCVCVLKSAFYKFPGIASKDANTFLKLPGNQVDFKRGNM